MLNGGVLDIAVLLIAAWFVLMCSTFWRLIKLPSLPDRASTARASLTVAGIGCATVAVGALFALHVSWISPAVSQRLGGATVKLLSLLLFWPALAGLFFSTLGSGRIRFLGIGTSLVTGAAWFYLYIAAVLSMGAPLARHPTKYLIPDGYVGWVEVRYYLKSAPALPIKNGVITCRLPSGGFLDTSSPLEKGWAHDEYYYYSADGAIRALNDTGWGFGGMIWGKVVESQQTSDGGKPPRISEYFYVGTEEKYHIAVSSNERRPFNESVSDKPVQ